MGYVPTNVLYVKNNPTNSLEAPSATDRWYPRKDNLTRPNAYIHILLPPVFSAPRQYAATKRAVS